MKTLYVTDLDGTLLNSSEGLSAYTVDTVNVLVERGMLFTYATGRSLVSASRVAAGLSTKIPVVAYNGAFIFEPSSGNILSGEFFREEDASAIIDALDRLDISPIVYAYVDGKECLSWLTTRENEGVRRYLDSRGNDPRFRPLEDKAELWHGDIFYFTCIGEKSELEPLYALFGQDERFTCTLMPEIYRPEWWCEMMPCRASKANAILRLKKLWGCDRIVCFGDAPNDLSMFRIADESYAVANAADELKAKATAIIASNDADGVAKWLAENAEVSPQN